MVLLLSKEGEVGMQVVHVWNVSYSLGKPSP